MRRWYLLLMIGLLFMVKPVAAHANDDEDEISVQQDGNGVAIYDVTTSPGTGSYKITVRGSFSKVLFATWTEKGGQDDLRWEEGSLNGNVATHVVYVRDHKNETGLYNTHVYAYDEQGRVKGYPITFHVVSAVPKVNNVVVSEGVDSYTISGEISGSVTKVLIPTWTEKNGQDDLIWETVAVKGSTFQHTVEKKNHKNESGAYISHIYSYDASGRYSVYPIQHTMKYVKPALSNVKINVGYESYTITADISSSVTRVMFPTWTVKNGQDDLLWKEGKINGRTVSFTVDIKDHKNEFGDYITHIYAYDVENHSSAVALNASIVKKRPVISDVKVTPGSKQYTISGKVSDNVTKVLIPTWTTKNGQDDLIWESAVIKGNTFSHTVYRKNHNHEAGQYISHIYAYDRYGDHAFYASGYDADAGNPKIEKVSIEGGVGTYTVIAEINKDVTRVLFPTWTTANGQDDLVWKEGTIKGNIATFTVDMKDHKYEAGEYNTHIYAYDVNDHYVLKAIKQNMKKATPKISDVQVSDVTSQGYLITCTVTDEYRLEKVLFPTWTTSNSQDDLVWGEGTIRGDKVSYRVYVKDHKYAFGEYNTHIYAYDASGTRVSLALPSVSINASSGSVGWKIVNGNKYLYDAKGNLVEGAGMLVIDISQHNGKIDWKAVKNVGVDGVILRSSYGYNYNGVNESYIADQMDATFKANIAELNRLGIPYGIYHFSYAKSIGDGAYEAQYMLQCMKEAGAKPVLPLYYDIEYSDYVGEKSNSFYTAIIHEFGDVVKKAGYTAGVYANYNWWMNKLNDASLNQYVKWVANYGSYENNAAGTANPNWHPKDGYGMWQYSSQGKVNGISGDVDMNALLNR